MGWQARLGVDCMGAVGVAAACQGRVMTTAAPPPFLPPPFLEGPSLRPTKPKPRCRIKGSNTCSRRDLGMVVGVGV